MKAVSINLARKRSTSSKRPSIGCEEPERRDEVSKTLSIDTGSYVTPREKSPTGVKRGQISRENSSNSEINLDIDEGVEESKEKPGENVNILKIVLTSIGIPIPELFDKDQEKAGHQE